MQKGGGPQKKKKKKKKSMALFTFQRKDESQLGTGEKQLLQSAKDREKLVRIRKGLMHTGPKSGLTYPT
jgi:hypothetical protein